MQRAIEKFRQNIKSVRELDSIYGLIANNYPLLEEQAQEILRAEIVLSVSALDCFIHDLIKQGMIETYQGHRNASKQFESYKIPFNFIKLISEPLDFMKLIENSDQFDDKLVYLENSIKENDLNKLAFLESAIEENNSKDSYQSPKGIEYALQLINITSLWKNIAVLMNAKADDVKNELSLIIDRRNKIAHEADYNMLTGSKYPIDRQNINDVIQFIESLCESIYKIAKNAK